MLLVQGDQLAPGHDIRPKFPEGVRLHDHRIIAEVSAGEAVVLGKLMVNFGSEVILGGNLLGGKAKNAYVAVAKAVAVRQRIESTEKARHTRIDLHPTRRKQPLARRRGR